MARPTGGILRFPITNSLGTSTTLAASQKLVNDVASTALKKGDYGIGTTDLPFLANFAAFDIQNGQYYARGSMSSSASLNAPPGSGNTVLTVTVKNYSQLVVHFEVIETSGQMQRKWIGQHYKDVNYISPVIWSEIITINSIASTSRYGTTKLNSATNSISEAEAATPFAIKKVYDFANEIKSNLPITYVWYPGGSEQSPGILYNNQRIIFDNPFQLNSRVLCWVEFLENNIWYKHDEIIYNGRDGLGTKTNNYGNKIVIQTGSSSVRTQSYHDGNPVGVFNFPNSLPYRVILVRLTN
ncbi:phage tail protein [Orbaceae bacterium ESL0727]|nr:phage tail protein [Orbaceae bacterium ESL0727]